MSIKLLFNKAAACVAGVSVLALSACVKPEEYPNRPAAEAFPSHIFDQGALRSIPGVRPSDRMLLTSAVDKGRIGRIVIQGNGYCTGFLVGPNVVMTADHCVEGADNKTMAPSHFTFRAGYNGGRSLATSKVKQVLAPSTSVLGNGENGVKHSYADYAFLILEDDLGNRFGYEKLAASLPRRDAHTDRFHAAAIGNSRRHRNALTGDFQCSFLPERTNPKLLKTNCSIDKGDSGGPLFVWTFNANANAYERRVVGVLSTKNARGGTAYSVTGLDIPKP